MNFFSFIFRKPVVEQDKLSGHYIAYYRNDLGIVSQGITKQEALDNLKEDIKIIKEFKKSTNSKAQKHNHNHTVAHS